MRQILNLAYHQATQGMDSEQRADFDFTINVDPSRAHMRREKNVDALESLMGGIGGR